MLNDFFRNLFFVKYVINVAYVIFKVVKFNENIVFIFIIIQMCFEFEFESSFDFFTKKNKNEQNFFTSRYDIKCYIHIKLNELIVQIMSIFIVRVEFVNVNSIIIF